MSIYKYQAYLAYQEINESIDDIMQEIDVNSPKAGQIRDLVNNQEEIFNRYNISSMERDSIKNKIEDTIRIRLGMNSELPQDN